MSITIRILLLLLAGLSSGCTPGGKIMLRSSDELQITLLSGNQNPRTWVLGHENPARARLAKWIDKNEYGWSSYVATTPGNGLLVDSSEWRLQFVEDWVLACPKKKGCWHKKVRPEEYEYLLQSERK